jgi:hypothetical protein
MRNPMATTDGSHANPSVSIQTIRAAAGRNVASLSFEIRRDRRASSSRRAACLAAFSL